MNDQLSPTFDPQGPTVTVQGSPEGISLARYIVGALDTAAANAATEPEFSYTDAKGERKVARAIHSESEQAQRSMFQVSQNLYTLTGKRPAMVAANSMIVVRGSSDDLALAEWILHVLDRPDPSVPSEFPVAGEADTLRAFYPSFMDSVQMFATVRTLRDQLQIRRAAQFDAPATIIVRGTADQIARAGELIRQQDQPPSTGLRPGWTRFVIPLKNATTGDSPDEISRIMPSATFSVLSSKLDTAGPSLTIETEQRQTSLAHYLADALDVTPAAAKTLPVFSYTDQRDEPRVIRAIHIENVRAQRSMLDIVTYLRVFGLFQSGTVGANSMVVIGGSANDVALGTWLLQVLDQPGTPPELVIPGGEIVHAFYPAQLSSIPQLARVTKRIRDQLQVKTAWQSASPSTIIVRGTPDQIEKARELIGSSSR
ncbi:MAG TPA: KH domain-containing protein [Bryobacteraceae bacterium]|nr:KH domain-containing protein [Bryobacteraceae bacterium]